MTSTNRAELRRLVEKLMVGDYSDSDELDRDANRLRASVPHPEVLGLIFHPDRYFASTPSVDDIVDRVLAYRAMEL